MCSRNPGAWHTELSADTTFLCLDAFWCKKVLDSHHSRQVKSLPKQWKIQKKVEISRRLNPPVDSVRLHIYLMNLLIITVHFNELVKAYKNYSESAAKAVKGPGEDIDYTYGLQGFAESWLDMEGGATQYVTPLSGSWLETFGILKEIK